MQYDGANTYKECDCGDHRQWDILPTTPNKHVDCEKEIAVHPYKNNNAILCVPSRVDFVNFEVGKSYMQRLRIINKSPNELRISIKPPSSPLLQVELCSKLLIVAGGDAILKLHFRPREPVLVDDEVVIRVTEGRDLRIPISCCMEHPVLNVIVNDRNATCENNSIYVGAALLGNTMRIPITFHSDAGHKFIIMSDKGWSDFIETDFLHEAILQAEISKDGNGNTLASSGCFTISPSCFTGGVSAVVVCRPPAVGFHVAMFRILSSTSVVRSLRLMADAVVYKPHHIRLKADERNYDILTGVEDPACEYYVHLGTTKPRGELTRIITLDNVSSVPYKYYWVARPWSNCKCSYDGSPHHETCCCEPFILTQRHQSVYAKPSKGTLPPGSSVSVEVHLYCAGHSPGVQRSVLMLILTEVPHECVSPEDIVVKRQYVDEFCCQQTRVLCDVVCAQLEVWWQVAPVTLVLHPPCLRIPFSRRVQSIPLSLEVTQHGVCELQATWDSPVPVSLSSAPNGTTTATVVVPLRDSAGNVDIRLKATDGSCAASAHIELCPEPQQPTLSPAYVWAGVVPPGGVVTAELVLRNTTSRMILWRATIFDCVMDTAKPQCACGERCPDCLLSPYLGTLEVEEQVTLKYKRTAVRDEGWKATLVQICVDGAIATGCAGLIAYRVLEPRLVLRVLDDGGTKEDGSAVLLPATLAAGRSSPYRLSITNTTTVPTVLRWRTAADKEEPLHVLFTPNVVEVGAYETVDVTVTLVARRVCRRRMFVCAASIQHASTPIYLLIVAAVAGAEVHVEVPQVDGTFQKISLKEPAAAELPPDLHSWTLAAMAEEFQRTGRLTVSSKTLIVRNVSHADAALVLAVRRPRQRVRQAYPRKDQWILHESCVAVDCTPWEGVVREGERGEVRVSVCGDTWGVYRDQLLVLIQNLEPLVVDLWMEVVGAPLKFIISDASDLPPSLWLASTDPARVLRATNYTRADINVYCFVVDDQAPTVNKLAFRLYFRLYEVPTECLCVKDASSKMEDSSNNCLHSDLGIELFLDDDCGPQDSSCYSVEPEYILVEKGNRIQWNISLLETRNVPLSALVVRSTAVQERGSEWYRPPPPLQLVRLRTSAHIAHLQVSEGELTVDISALDLRPTDVIRKRRKLEIKNTGNGFLTLLIKTKEPWRVIEDRSTESNAGNKEQEEQDLEEGKIKIVMQPDSSKKVLVELNLEAKQVCPEPGEQYDSYLLTTTPLSFCDDQGQEILCIPLTMRVDRPVLAAEPDLIDLGLVSDGHAKKTYFTVTHTSRYRTVVVQVYVEGDENFKIHPGKLKLAPGETQNVYLQYTCRWTGERVARAVVRVRARAAWCAVSVRARAQPTRHVARTHARDHSDFTDDVDLLPPLL